MTLGKPSDARVRILDAALRLMARDGASGVSAAALAVEAGVSKANLFHHFGTLETVTLQAFDRLALGATSPPAPARDLASALRAIGVEALTTIGDDADTFRAWFGFQLKALHDDALAARLRGALDEAVAVWTDYLAPHAGDRAPALAGLVAAALDGLILRALLGDGGETAERWELFADEMGRLQP